MKFPLGKNTRAFFSNILKKIADIIKKSLSSGNEVSSSRLQSYLLLLPVIGGGVFFLVIELVNAILSWHLGKPYVPSNEALVVYGMILSHHTATLFNRTKQIVPKGLKNKSEPLENSTTKDKRGDYYVEPENVQEDSYNDSMPYDDEVENPKI
jgi:hypothetical protein